MQEGGELDFLKINSKDKIKQFVVPKSNLRSVCEVLNK